MNLSMHECGDCVGCQLKARMNAHVKMIDELFVPRLAKAERAMSSATDRRDPVFVEADRAYQGLLEVRSRYIQDIVDGYGAAGCVAPLITADPAPT